MLNMHECSFRGVCCVRHAGRPCLSVIWSKPHSVLCGCLQTCRVPSLLAVQAFSTCFGGSWPKDRQRQQQQCWSCLCKMLACNLLQSVCKSCCAQFKPQVRACLGTGSRFTADMCYWRTVTRRTMPGHNSLIYPAAVDCMYVPFFASCAVTSTLQTQVV
jgi:hypothetical protein